MSVRPDEQHRFDSALRKNAKGIRNIKQAILLWSDELYLDQILESTLFDCGLYYSACLPEAQPRRSRAPLKRSIKKANALAEELVWLLRQVWDSRDPTVRRVLEPVLDQYVRGRDGIPREALAPPLLNALDELSLRLALLEQALPNDIGGQLPQSAFAELAQSLAGIYCTITLARTAPTSKRERFYKYVAAVTDVIAAVKRQFPRARFDLPVGKDALPKALSRIFSDTAHPSKCGGRVRRNAGGACP